MRRRPIKQGASVGSQGRRRAAILSRHALPTQRLVLLSREMDIGNGHGVINQPPLPRS